MTDIVADLSTFDGETTTTTATTHQLSHSVSITSVADFGNPEQQQHQQEQELSIKCKNVAPGSPFASTYTNLCSASKGARVLFATDDWFACAENLLKDDAPVFVDDLYCEQGKVMDGWETRRRREVGHDWCIIQLPERADIRALEIDTAHFTGNHVPQISMEIADIDSAALSKMVTSLPNAFERLLHGGVQGSGQTPDEVHEALAAVETVDWQGLLPATNLRPGYEPSRMYYSELPTPKVGNILRLNYFPDGGVARLRVWGRPCGAVKPTPKPLYMPIQTGPVCTVVAHSTVTASADSTTAMTSPSLPSQQPYEYVELSSQELGGTGVECSNKHYGEPWRLTQKGLGRDMGDGWETARHPSRPGTLIKHARTGLIDSPLMDYAILKLGQVAHNGAARIIIDTRHFRGNYPESILLEGCSYRDDDGDDNEDFSSSSLSDAEWFPLISRTRMSPDAEHVFERSKNQLQNSSRSFTHVRVSIFPDGGISRVRVYG